MKHFTREQIEEIRVQLATKAVRDSDFDETFSIQDKDFVPILQDEKNKRISAENMFGPINEEIEDMRSTFVTRSVDDLTNYYTKKELYSKDESYSKEEIDELIRATKNFHYEIYPNRGAVKNPSPNVLYLIGPVSIPEGSDVDDLYQEWVYWHNTWTLIGTTGIELSTKQDKLVSGENIKTVNGQSIVGSGNLEIGDLNAVKFIQQTLTPEQKEQSRTNIGAGTYSLPSGGVPKTDLSQSVQTSLDTADSAYQKPNSGVPKTDLASGVQSSLDLADSSVQANPVGSVTPAVDPYDYATREELSQLGQKVDDISTGKYYGYYASASDLPTSDSVPGFAYVGTGPTYTIYSFNGTAWTSSGITVNQSPIGNDEDIDQNEGGKLQFANRVYNAQQPNGMGYKILRKDATFAEQVTEANTIYEIRYDFDLDGASVTIPAGCVLRFVGGKILNGTINFGNTFIEAADVVVFENITFSNCQTSQEVRSVWFGLSESGNNNATVLQSIVNNFRYCYINLGSYNMEGAIDIASTARIKKIYSEISEQGIIATKFVFPSSHGLIVHKRIELRGVSLKGTRGTYNSETGIFENGFVGLDLYTGCVVEYCDISGWETGITTDNGNIIAAVFRKNVIGVCGNYGMKIVRNQAGTCNANLIVSNYFVNNGYNGLVISDPSTGKLSGIGLYIHGGSGNVVLQNTFEYCSGIGLFVDKPNTTAIIRGLTIVGNYFEFNKYANMFLDLSASNPSVLYNIFVNGNSFSDSVNTPPDGTLQARQCALLDPHGFVRRKNFIIENANLSIYSNYKSGKIADWEFCTTMNSAWEALDWSKREIVLKNTTIIMGFIMAKPSRGIYQLRILAKNVGTATRLMSLQSKLNGDAVVTHVVSIPRNAIYQYFNFSKLIFVHDDCDTITLAGAYLQNAVEGDEVDIQEIKLERVDSVATATREGLQSPYSGMVLFDTTLGKCVVYNGSAWVNMDGTALS